jgi:flagella basal body P-ring formation protein FlgA
MPLLSHKKDLCHNSRRHAGRVRRWLLASILCTSAAVTAMADTVEMPIESLPAIKEAAHSFIVQQIGQDFPSHVIEVSDLDARLKLTACDAPLEGFLPPGGRLPGNTTVGVRCPGSKPWTVYVPAEVKVKRPVVVTKHPLLRGSAIGKNDIRLEEREISGNIDAYIFDTEHVLGMIAKRPMAAATALKPAMLDAPLLVHRGQQIIILAEGSGLEVRMSGTALMDGSEGQLVRVKNTISQRTIEGLVIKPGIIKVNM